MAKPESLKMWIKQIRVIICKGVLLQIENSIMFFSWKALKKGTFVIIIGVLIFAVRVCKSTLLGNRQNKGLWEQVH